MKMVSDKGSRTCQIKMAKENKTVYEIPLRLEPASTKKPLYENTINIIAGVSGIGKSKFLEQSSQTIILSATF